MAYVIFPEILKKPSKAYVFRQLCFDFATGRLIDSDYNRGQNC